MNDHIFNQLCETYGMAPAKPLRDLVKDVWKLALSDKELAMAEKDIELFNQKRYYQQMILEMQQRIFELEQAKPEFSAAEIVRKLGETNDPKTTR